MRAADSTVMRHAVAASTAVADIAPVADSMAEAAGTVVAAMVADTGKL